VLAFTTVADVILTEMLTRHHGQDILRALFRKGPIIKPEHLVVAMSGTIRGAVTGVNALGRQEEETVQVPINQPQPSQVQTRDRP
jgi:hypothetical protein